jgi:hypothetical protein
MTLTHAYINGPVSESQSIGKAEKARMDDQFEQLRAAFPQFAADYTPPWGLPTANDFAYLAARYGCEYPPSFIRFQTCYAAVLPAPDNAFLWANRGLEPYLSIEAAIAGARRMGVPEQLAPFWSDEGNFTCFDTGSPGPGGEFPVVFWDHDAGSAVREAVDFVQWLAAAYQRR